MHASNGGSSSPAQLHTLALELAHKGESVAGGCNRAWECADTQHLAPRSQGVQARLHGWNIVIAEQLASLCCLEGLGTLILFDEQGKRVTDD